MRRTNSVGSLGEGQDPEESADSTGKQTPITCGINFVRTIIVECNHDPA